MTRRKYDFDEFVVPAHDSEGRFVSLSLRIPPLLAQALRAIVKSHKFPFTSKGGVTRWCIYHSLHGQSEWKFIRSYLINTFNGLSS